MSSFDEHEASPRTPPLWLVVPLIVLASVAAILLPAVVIFAIAYVRGVRVEDHEFPSGPEWEEPLQPGGRIVDIDGSPEGIQELRSDPTWLDLRDDVILNGPVDVNVERDGEGTTLQFVPGDRILDEVRPEAVDAKK